MAVAGSAMRPNHGFEVKVMKMVHNGIEHGFMAAYAGGFNILGHANAGKEGRGADAETAPLQKPELYRFDFNLAEVTRCGAEAA
jgi:6-phosphogluconate dehydrogenase (decarboxylating)